MEFKEKSGKKIAFNIKNCPKAFYRCARKKMKTKDSVDSLMVMSYAIVVV